MLAGFGAGLAMVVVVTTMDLAVGPFVMAAGVVAIVGTLFQLNEHWIVEACHGWLPDSLAAPLVAGLIASVVGAAVWLMAGMTTPMLFGGERSVIDQVLRQVPTGALGGMLGGAATGLILELMGFRLEDQGAGGAVGSWRRGAEGADGGDLCRCDWWAAERIARLCSRQRSLRQTKILRNSGRDFPAIA